MKSKLTFYTSILSSLLLLQNPTFAAKSPHLVSQTAIKTPNCEIEPEEEEGEYSPQQLQTLASRITMRVIGDNNGGSGTIIGKRGNKYLIVTNSHVIQGVNSIQVQAFDGKNYSAQVVPNNNFEKFDLALLEFQTSQNYCLPDIADFIPNQEMEVLAAGFSGEKGKIMFRKGKIDLISQSPLKGGYSIGYTSDIDQGMSGGAMINTQGTLVGINGKSAYPILNTGYVYQNGSKPNQEEIQQFRKLSWGVPIRTFLVEVNPEILTAYDLPLPNNNIELSTASKLPPWLQEIESKAKQFTVRIDSSSKANGSGIIIAKEGDTYTVLTAAHVLCENEVKSCPSYEVMTDDGEKYSVEKNTIQTKAGVDLGILKFKSQGNYQVATLADYNPNKDDYIFTVGYPKLANQSPWRFSPGLIFDKESGLLHTRQSDFQSNIDSDGKLQTVSQTVTSLTGGYELVYTSITYGGMSGGAVLDSQGRVIGIHGRAEGEEVNDHKTGNLGVNPGYKVQIGYSLGIPISTFLGQKFDVQPQKVKKTPAQQLTAQQKKSIQEAVLSADFSKGNAKASQWLERGNKLWRLRRYKEAVKAFEQAIKQQPKSNFIHLAHYGKGLVLGTQGKHEESITAFEQAVKLKPGFVAAWNNLSVVYREFKQPDKALVVIDKAIQLQPKNPNLYNQKYVVLERLKRYTEAELAINKAIEIVPRAAFHINRGKLYHEQKKWKLALADYNKAIQINPNFTQAYYNRGLLYQQQKKFKLALANYNKAIQINSNFINPDFAALYNNRGLLYQQQKKWELALADYNKTIQINPNNPMAYYNRGLLYQQQKKWELALADYNKAIQINPNYANVYNNRGVLYKEQKKWKLALADYHKAIQINPNDTDAYNNRGILYKEQKKWELALADYNKAIQINPNYAKAYNNRGVLYKEQKKWKLALADFNKAIEINPNEAKTYNSRGNFYYEQKEWELAISDYNKAIQINPSYVDAYIKRGLVFHLQKKHDLALADYNKAIQINPNDVAYFGRAVLLTEQKKWDLALADYNKTIQINPNDASVYYSRANVYYKQRKWDLALADYNKSIQINPNYANAYYNRATIYSYQEKWDLALADYKKAIQINPNYANAYNARGIIYEHQKITDLALANFSKAIQINSKYAIAYNNRGNIYKEQKKWSLALNDFNKAIQINSKYAEAYLSMGFIYYKLKKLDLSLANFNKAIQLNPKYINAYYNRGKIYKEQKKLDLALADFNKAIQLNPNLAQAYIGIGAIYLEKKDKQKTIENFQQAAKLFKAQKDTKNYKIVIDLLQKLKK